ncbi:ATP-binding protein [Bradyrhizobium sp. WYCCWR 13022]|uniref:GAF domain-containing sensor histidine kinase n=1 Tax=unclassified Bradyrhizobium TaxID=2631580 RepID=UPI00263AC93B|nr:ATP-binding protein [Bradyrhizobium sp. WYCCWR 13022]MDN4985595.1 ATP-binding protein [Bradyrhizobium sp. WYCCWR 13022]
MSRESETSELELVAKAFQVISREISYQGLAKALLAEALSYSGATRGAILLSGQRDMLAKADASFPRERANFLASFPQSARFSLPEDLAEEVLGRKGTVVRVAGATSSALIDATKPSSGKIAQLCVPLVHQNWAIGVIYLESDDDVGIFTPQCVRVISMLASQAAISFESVRLFEALRETNMWMVRGQQIGGMGSYRWNTRTLLSRGSRECYRILDLDLDVNPVPFEMFISRIHPEDYPALERALGEAISTKSPFAHEYRVIHRDGKSLHVVAVGQFDEGPTGDLELEGIITDISQRKAAEQALADARNELAHASGLTSLGELAGSIIHEIDQPLTGILTSAEACARWLDRDPAEAAEARKSIARIIRQARRTADVVTGVRSLVRGAQVRFAEFDINDAVAEVLLLSKREVERAGVVVRTDFDRTAPRLEADRVQIQQVALNLVRNAIEAMTEVGEGNRILTVSSWTADDMISVAIADTGTGVDPADRDRVFETLYTTKGAGLGLGLSICRKIVRLHGGKLWVEENGRCGARFTFSLPRRQAVRGARIQ